MNGILLELWKLTLQSALIITVILLIRSIFKGKINPKLQYALWLLPMMRLLIPFSIPSAASILNVFEPVTQRISTAVSITSSNASLFQQAEDTLSNVEIGNPADYSQIQASGFDWLALLLYVWIAGMAAVALYSFFVNIRFGLISKKSRQKVELPEKARDLLRGKGLNVYLCDSVYTPCLCGFFRPYILITKKALESEETLNMVLMHEYSHFKQHDNIYAFVRCLLCAIYWFNLFVWIAAAKSRQDCETACDTHVLKNFNSIKCQDYGMALINVIDRSKNMPEILKGVTTMSSSKKELKERISLIGHQPRMLKLTALVIAFIITAVTIVACTGTLENQADKPEPTPINILANTDETEDTLEPKATPLQAPKAERVFDRTKPEEIAEEFLTRYFEAANNGGWLGKGRNNFDGLIEFTESNIVTFNYLQHITLAHLFRDYNIASDMGYFSAIEDINITPAKDKTIVDGYFKTTAFGSIFKIELLPNQDGTYKITSIDFPDNTDYLNYYRDATRLSKVEGVKGSSAYIMQEYESLLKECIDGDSPGEAKQGKDLAVCVAKWFAVIHTVYGMPYNINNPNVELAQPENLAQYTILELSGLYEIKPKMVSSLWLVSFDPSNRDSYPIYVIDAETYEFFGYIAK